MTRHPFLAALAAACLLAALAAPAAHAGPSFQLAANAKSVDGLVDPGGTLHAVWADDVVSATNVVHYCEVPRGATACTSPRALLLPLAGDHTDEPYLVRGAGQTLHVAMARSAEEDAYVWTSPDDGATWGAATKVYDGHPCTNEAEPLLGPVSGEITFVGSNTGHCVHGAAIDGSESTASLVADPPSGGVRELRRRAHRRRRAARGGRQPVRDLRLAPAAGRRPEQHLRLGRRPPRRHRQQRQRRRRPRRRLRPQRGDVPRPLSPGPRQPLGWWRLRLARRRRRARDRQHARPHGRPDRRGRGGLAAWRPERRAVQSPANRPLDEPGHVVHDAPSRSR